jgi:hypothetical protein
MIGTYLAILLGKGMVNPTKLVPLIRRLRYQVVFKATKVPCVFGTVYMATICFGARYDFLLAIQTVCDFVTTVTMKFQGISYIVVGKNIISVSVRYDIFDNQL